MSLPTLSLGTVSPLDLGTWPGTVAVSDLDLQFPAVHAAALGDLLNDWATRYPREETWCINNHHVPSLLTRFDCVLSPDGVNVIEIEDRPSGLGLTQALNADTVRKVRKWQRRFPPFAALASDTRPTDDLLWLPAYTDATPKDAPLLVRCNPDETAFDRYQRRCIAPLKTEGNKSYGIGMGFWHGIRLNGTETPDQLIERLDFSQAAAFKSDGTRCKRVALFHPQHKRLANNRGFSTKRQVANKLSGATAVYRQPYLEPESFDVDGKPYWRMWRIFFGYNPETRRYDCLNGLWCSVPNRIIHGTPDTIWGHALVECP